jgi:GeoRSP system SPASM domain protein
VFELSSPIRLYWDLLPDQPADDYIDTVCTDVAALRFLSIHLRDLGESLAPATTQAIEQLSSPGRALLLTTSLSVAEGLEGVLQGKLRQLLVHVISAAEISQVAELRRRFSPLSVGISLAMPNVSLTKLPSLLQMAVGEGLFDIHFPMQRLTAGEPCWTPSQTELDAFSEQIQANQLPAAVKLTIHDPFLWRAFHAELPFPDGGCQAANTMLYVATDGQVYSCPLVPVSLGNLHGQSLRQIAVCPAKVRLRETIKILPQICSECPDLAGCHAGCRGRAFVLSGWSAHDPACGR